MKKIKICGNMDEAGVRICIRNKVDIIGFVVEYPTPVPWNIDYKSAAPLIELAKKSAKTAVVCGASFEEVKNTIDFLHPDFIQIHYSENEKENEQILDYADASGTKVIMHVPLDDFSLINKLEKTSVYAYLFDTRVKNNESKSGGRINENISAAKKINEVYSNTTKKIIIAGGIDSKNISDICNMFKCDCLDILSGAEEKNGFKSEEKIKAIMDKKH